MALGSKIGKQHSSTDFLKNVPDSQILVEAAVRRGQSMTDLIEPQSPSMARVDLARWKNALMAAQNVDFPNMNPMFEVYDNIMIDNTLTSIIDTRILKVKQAKFKLIDKAGNPNFEAKKLLEKEWFNHFIELAMLAQFEGFSLIEVFDFDPLTNELQKVSRVNKYHVKPKKGIVTKQPNDDNGFDYTQNPFYISVGQANNLGLLYKAAPHILAKKFALGTWAEYNEKIGIPFRTVHTNTTDKTRQQQLAVIMDKMGSAGWAVLQENEKVELLTNNGSDPTKCFEQIIVKLDSEPAMLILGQSSTSNSQNNKGTYGSMQILQDISDDRHEADLVTLKYLTNNVLMPRLVQLSTAYSVFSKLYFEWDKSEDLSVKETVDYVVALSAMYNIDPEYVTSKTGIPIIGLKQANTSTPPVDTKKKILTSKIQAFYSTKCCANSLPVAINSNGFEPDILRIAKAIFDNKQKGIVDIQLMKKTANELMNALNTSYTTSTDNGNIELYNQLRDNVHVFSGFKTYEQLRAITDKLTDENGKVRSFNDFKKEALALNQTYNVRYLNAEYNHALTSGAMASQWLDIQANKDILPLLEFDATLDNRTTSVCKSLDGVRLPVDDEFWHNYYLPLHWGERSVIRQVASGTLSDKSKIDAPTLQPMFKGNVGRDGVAFPDTHPYYDVINKDKKEILKTVERVYPKESDYKEIYKSKSGGTVSIHSTHKKNEIKDNTRVAKILADNKHKVKLLDYLENRKNPDASIDEIVSDFKKMDANTKSSFYNQVSRASDQLVSICVIELHKDVTTNNLIDYITYSLANKSRKKTVKELWLLKGKTIIKINRKDIYNNKFIELL